MEELNAVGELVPKKKKDPYAFSRVMYIIEALVEYLISITISGAYLAKITEAIGIDDGLTGIITAFISLGHVFQLFALLLTGVRRVKPMITVSFIINQTFFALLYIVPLIDLGRATQTVLFIALILSGYIITNIMSPSRTNWMMSFVDTRGRGVFTAKKEIVSLIGGMIYSVLIGNVITYFEEKGELKTAFIICAVTIFVFMIMHTATLLLTKEKVTENSTDIASQPHSRHRFDIMGYLKDKRLLAVVAVYVMWYIANYVSTPFYGTYQNKELGFMLSFVSIISVASSISRAVLSIPIGRFADKHSFTKMLTLTFGIAAVGFLVCGFAVPSNGKIVFTAYSVLHAIALAGINGGSINLIYEYVESENKTGALAFSFAASGLFGFLTTLVASKLVSFIQAHGFSIFGINLYAQQVVSFIAAFIVILIIIYLNTVVKGLNKRKDA